MSYRGIQVYYSHFIRDFAGIAGLSSLNAVDSDFPLDNLIDDRQTRQFKFDQSQSNHYVDIDMGSTFADFVDTIIIPAGHTLSGVACDLLGDTTHPPTNSRATFNHGDTTIIKETVSDAGTSYRYWRLHFNTNGAHAMAQIVLSFKKVFDNGFVMVGARDSFVHSFNRFEQPSGVSVTLKTGLRRRVSSLPFKHPVETTDLTIAKAWASTCEMQRPFYIDRPSFSATPNIDDPTLHFKFATDPDEAWGTKVPNSEVEKKAFTFDLIESVD